MPKSWPPGLLAVAAIVVCALVIPRHFRKTPKPGPVQPASSQPSPFANTKGGLADIMLVNGHIYTMDPEHPWASAVAIRGEAIIAVNYSQAPPPTPAPGGGAHGDSNELKNFRGRNTRVIDLRGQFAMPGFNDAPLHLAEAAYGKNDVNLVATSSLADFEQRIRVTLSFYKPDEWIVGRGWDHSCGLAKFSPRKKT